MRDIMQGLVAHGQPPPAPPGPPAAWLAESVKKRSGVKDKEEEPTKKRVATPPVR